MKRIRTRLRTPALAAVIFVLNVYLCWGLFGTEYLRHMGSMDGAFIGLSRYAKDHWGDLTWFPPWHLGMPYANVYPPLMFWGVAATAALSGMSVVHAFHWATALLYCLGPVALFALAKRLSGSSWGAFTAAALYSLVSWSAWLIPPIAVDLGSHFHPRRLQAMLLYGETPHIASMTLIPLALLWWDLALERRRAPYVLLAALGLAATVLTSWLGGCALALMIGALALARLPKWRDMTMMAAIAASAYCLAMPWTAPSTIAATQFNSKTLGGDFRESYLTLPKWGLAAIVALVAVKWMVRKLDRGLQFAILFALLMTSLVLGFTLFGIAPVPQPGRYHLEMEMALSLLAALGGYAVFKSRPRAAAIAIGLMCIALFPLVRQSRRYSRDVLIQPIDISKTTEWKIAQWLNHEWTGERVMMPGSISFWLLAFSDVPQFHGGPEQGVIDYMVRVAFYGIYRGAPFAAGRNGEYSIIWMKALGVQATGVSFPDSSEAFKPFIDPHQFDGLLEPIYRDGGDVIYRVGAPHASLARIVARNALVAVTPKNGIDVDPLRPYVAALDDPAIPRADFQWTSMHSARIAADLKPDQAVSVQMAWHKGWHATFNKQPVAIQKDGIGFMYIAPARAGPCEIEMIYDGGFEMRVAHALSTMAAVLLVVMSLRRKI